jgi:hypothetical protein
MSYMNCPRCGLSARLRPDRSAWEYCPRCLGRHGISVPIYVTSRRLWSSVSPEDPPVVDGHAVRAERIERAH